MRKDTFEKYKDYISIIWDEDSNEELTHNISRNSKYYFRCEDYSYITYQVLLKSIIKKINSGWTPGSQPCRCPVCSGSIRVPGHNDVFTLYPELREQWSDKNSYNPSTVSFNIPIIWKCPVSGGEWEADIHSRVRYGKDNGFQSVFVLGKKVLPGFNDIATTHPDEVLTWDYDKNTLSPQEVTQYSHNKAWWIDSKGNSYEMSIQKRCGEQQGSPFDAGKKISPGESLADLYPDLVTQWDYENNTIQPYEVTPKSSRKVYWICPETHMSWSATVKQRVNSGTLKSPFVLNKKVVAGYNDLASLFPDISAEYSPNNPLSAQQIVTGSKKSVLWICSVCSHEWSAPVENRVRLHSGCPECWRKSYISTAENDIAEFINSLDSTITVIRNNRTIIAPKELDIYVPEKNIAIEYNGIFWHTEKAGKDKLYHYNKWKECAKHNIQLITIWEDDWTSNQELIKTMLAHKFGYNSSERIFARKTTLQKISYREASQFLSANHIQGSSHGSLYIGLFHKDYLVAVSVWRKQKDVLYLDRYATSQTVVGGMGKLLNYGIKYAKDNNIHSIVTFSDHTLSDGKLYKTLGFIKDKELSPDYKYVYNNILHHKFNFRIKRFREDPLLAFQDGLTENELAALNNIDKVWDCGKTRWILPIV